MAMPADPNEDRYMSAAQDADFVATFWPRVSRGADCWIWTGGKSGAYGQLQYRRRRLLAHRLSWCIANGKPCPSGLVIRHRCDNPPCVNPAHLETGSIAQNVRDTYTRRRRAEGTWIKGVDRPNAVLNDRMVTDLRRAARGGRSIRSLAIELGIAQSTAHRAIRGDGWPHVSEPPVPRVRRGRPHPRNFVRNNPEVAAEARALRDEGLSLQQVADQLGITKTAAFNCCRTDAKEL